MSFEHPFFDSYKKNTNNIAKNDEKLDFAKLYENLNFISKEKIAKGEKIDIVSELNSYSGNISTRQLKNIDYSKFSNHTFFDSAVHKVSYAYNEIINFPYDKPEHEVKKYLSELDGYTEYVLQNIYPKYTGHIQFDGNTKVIISDRKGILLNDFTGDLGKRDGFLSPSNKNFSFSFHLKVPLFNDVLLSKNQTIFKKTITDLNNNITEGYFCYITYNSESECLLTFGIKPQDNQDFFTSNIKVEYDKTSYVNININILDDKFNADFFINGNIQKTITTNNVNYKEFSENFKNKDVYFILGDGDNEKVSDDITLNALNLGLDEFIFLNKNRDGLIQKLWKDENIYTDSSVLLYLKFNEPGGNHTNASLVLDSSGNKLHGLVFNQDNQQITDTSDIKINISLLSQEDSNKSPVILGTYPDVISTRDSLLLEAKKFDSDNSNIVFNMLPTHYFTNSSNFENKTDFISSEVVVENSIGFADNTTQKNTHLTNLCLIWARFFDQLKLYVDALSGLYDLDYDSINREDFVNSQMHLLCKMHGFDFKEIDLNKTKKKIENKNLTYDDIISEVSLTKLQNLIWKKILLNSQSIIRSKGTLRSIDFLFNSVGFDAKKYTNIEEKSYENFVNIEDRFSYEKSKFKMLDFGKNINVVSEFNDNSIDVINKPILKVENITSNHNDDKIDGVSSEFTVETFFDFNKLIYNRSIYENEKKYNTIQSILRLNDSNNNCFLNCYAKFNKNTDTNFSLVLEYIPCVNGTELKQEITLSNLNAYDMEHYVNVSFKFDNNLGTINFQLSHGFVGDVIDKNSLSVISKTIDIKFLNTNNNLNLLYLFNRSFSLVTGEQKYSNNLLESSNDRTIFEGRIICVRLWKKFLSYNECLLHSKDITNISEDDIKILKNSSLISNFLFNEYSYSNKESSENKIVIGSANYSKPYTDTELNSEAEGVELNFLTLKFGTDYTNDLSLFSFNDLVRKKSSVKLDLIDNNHLKRVRILSYNDEENKKAYNNFEVYPVHDIPVSYNSYKTNFLSIDMSVTKSIDDAISNLINNVDQFSKLLSSNLGIYQTEYHMINQLRKDYFEQYLDTETSINFEEINNLYKYFDTILNSILFSLIPQNINFKGFNLVYESHVLERSKYQYKNKDSNIPVQDIYDYKTTRLDYNDIVAKRDLNYKDIRKVRE